MNEAFSLDLTQVSCVLENIHYLLTCKNFIAGHLFDLIRSMIGIEFVVEDLGPIATILDKTFNLLDSGTFPKQMRTIQVQVQ